VDYLVNKKALGNILIFYEHAKQHTHTNTHTHTQTLSESLVKQFLASRLQAAINTKTPRPRLGPPPAQGLSLGSLWALTCPAGSMNVNAQWRELGVQRHTHTHTHIYTNSCNYIHTLLCFYGIHSQSERTTYRNTHRHTHIDSSRRPQQSHTVMHMWVDTHAQSGYLIRDNTDGR